MTRLARARPFGHFVAALAAVCVISAGGCGKPEEPSAEATIKLTSPAFEHGGAIPEKHTGQGDDISPPLAWSDLPAGTKELALICDDPDAPSRKKPGPKPWVHWVIYKIPADAQSLPEGVPKDEQLDEPAGAFQGTSSFGEIGYGGPMPPAGSGPHRYFFKLYALDTPLDVTPGLSKDELLEAIKDHVLAKGELMGTYEVPE